MRIMETIGGMFCGMAVVERMNETSASPALCIIAGVAAGVISALAFCVISNIDEEYSNKTKHKRRYKKRCRIYVHAPQKVENRRLDEEFYRTYERLGKKLGLEGNANSEESDVKVCRDNDVQMADFLRMTKKEKEEYLSC